MQFSPFLGIKEMKDLIVKKYNQDLQDIRNWWNDHDNGSRQWTNVSISGTLTTSRQIFHDRGDPAAADFSSFTNDGAYHDLDLSSIVPAGASVVALVVNVTSTVLAGGDVFQLRTKGNTHTINQSFFTTLLPNLAVNGDAIVACDVNRKIQYIMNFAGSPTVSVTVKGWWL